MQSKLTTSGIDEVSRLLRSADALMLSRQLRDAEIIFRRVISVSPGAVLAYAELGRCLAEQGRWREAIAAYRKSLELDPDLTYVYDNLGLALMRYGRCREAVSPLRRAVLLCPDAWRIRWDLGRALLDCHDFEAAGSEYRKCLEQRSEDPGVRYELGMALLGMGSIQDALVEFRRCAQISTGDFKVCERIGVCLLALKRPWDAVAPLRRSAALNPQHADTWMGLACAFGLTGQRDSALAALVRSVELEPASFGRCWSTCIAFIERFFRIGRARDLAGAGIVLALALGIGRFRCLAAVLLRPLRDLAPDVPCEADTAGLACDAVGEGGQPESATSGDGTGAGALD